MSEKKRADGSLVGHETKRNCAGKPQTSAF